MPLAGYSYTRSIWGRGNDCSRREAPESIVSRIHAAVSAIDEALQGETSMRRKRLRPADHEHEENTRGNASGAEDLGSKME